MPIPLLKKLSSLFKHHKLNVLLWGSTARDHAIALKLSKSKLLNKLYLSFPNDGYKHLGEPLNLDGKELIKAVKDKRIDLLIIGTEYAQFEGMTDAFKKFGIKTIGVDKYWAQLESHKTFSKEFMKRNDIPTPKYQIASSIEEFENSIKDVSFPVAIKSVLMISNSGQGVVIANNYTEAKETAEKFLTFEAGELKNKVIIEEFINGEELSLITLWDGITLKPLLPVKDYKKLHENNRGPNTAGLGAYCPVKITDKQEEQINTYLNQLEAALKKENADFTGILYSGLIFDETKMYVLEYNVRLGDPEGQALITHLDSDLLEIFDKMSQKKLSETKIKWKKGTTACVVVACNGYPKNPKTGSEVRLRKRKNIEVFYCGVKRENNSLFSCGGRVLTVCKTGKNPYRDIYRYIYSIKFKDKYFRKDIGS